MFCICPDVSHTFSPELMRLGYVNPIKVRWGPSVISTGNGEEVKAMNSSAVMRQVFVINIHLVVDLDQPHL
jgi:hypothetical protein